MTVSQRRLMPTGRSKTRYTAVFGAEVVHNEYEEQTTYIDRAGAVLFAVWERPAKTAWLTDGHFATMDSAS